MAVSLTADAVGARELGGLTEIDIAAATGTTPDTVRAWLGGRLEPAGVPAQRLRELVSEVERLSRLIKRDAIAGWLRTPIPLLAGATPLDTFAAGRGREVARLVSGLEDPGAS